MIETLLLFAIAELVLSLSPGPAVLLVISKALQHGFRVAVFATLGIIAVNLLYFLLSLIGVGAALAASSSMFLTLKYAGAAYLVWTAWEIVRDMRRPLASNIEESPDMVAPARGAVTSAFAAGAVTQLASIKNIMVFLAIVPQFVDPAQDATIQFFGLAVVSVAVELPVLLAYALLAATISVSVQSQRTRNWIDGVSASILLAIAGSVLWSAAAV